MRLWTLHPVYLDARGLTACWREALLAQKVLSGRTQGYRHHPQLQRFRQSGDPIAAIRYYLLVLWQEANRRAYRFDLSRIDTPAGTPPDNWLSKNAICCPNCQSVRPGRRKHLKKRNPPCPIPCSPYMKVLSRNGKKHLDDFPDTRRHRFSGIA